ncbi:transcription factor bHLH94 [Lathyrus oleraceus]|uniref:BHLH domain-containing protein n=1 Tax=Pisum sativum TaxID=3888 RepID=A0A9D5AAI3_PEA|nr:transcription factor bHLH94-like [Pisum sativum]KAI5398480.1 hypothetical protein KIW84_064026 [Pisum sativum]
MCLPEKVIDRAEDMALEAVVFPQTQDPFGYGIKDFYNFNFNNFVAKEQEQEQRSFSFVENQTENNYPYYGDWNNNISTLNELQETTTDPSSNNTQNLDTSPSIDTVVRPKRRRARSRKNKEEIENQRMNHIAVERNRRKQMNEYLSVLRSLMPDSYIQRGDQASIIGGAINFVKELEHKFQFLGAKKEKEVKSDDDDDDDDDDAGGSNKKPFSEFFSFPQYSTSTSNSAAVFGEKVGEIQSRIADIEVTMVESHANLKIRSKKRPKQLLKMVSGFHNMRLTILHLNVTTTGEFVLFSLSVKVEDDCKLGSVDDIAAAVYQMVNRIQQEAMLN